MKLGTTGQWEKRRGWLLLLLPWLWLASFGQSLHNHSLVASAAYFSSNATQDDAAHHAVQAQSSVSAESHAHTAKCLICEWASASVAHFATPISIVPQLSASAAFQAPIASHPRPAVLRAGNRGPPLM